MRTGRPPKSQAQKALNGTLQKCRPQKEQANFTPLMYVPDVPKWIEGDDLAATEWRRLAPLLIADNALAEKDLQTLAHLCITQSRIMRNFRGDTEVDGEPISAAGCHTTYIKYASALGLASGWRARVPVSETKKSANPFDELKQRPN